MSFRSLMNLKAIFHQTIIHLNMEMEMVNQEDLVVMNQVSGGTQFQMSGMKKMKFNKCVIQNLNFTQAL